MLEKPFFYVNMELLSKLVYHCFLFSDYAHMTLLKFFRRCRVGVTPRVCFLMDLGFCLVSNLSFTILFLHNVKLN